jgi:hypothetical protein
VEDERLVVLGRESSLGGSKKLEVVDRPGVKSAPEHVTLDGRMSVLESQVLVFDQWTSAS